MLLGEVGDALDARLSIGDTLDRLLLAARSLAGADGATLYRVNGNALEFVRVYSRTLRLDGVAPERFPSIPLYRADGAPNTATVASYCALYATTVNVADVYHVDGFDFAGARAFDGLTGYHTRSLLSVPVSDSDGQTIAVMQLVNAIDLASGGVAPFSAEQQRLVETLASQAAVAWERHALMLRNDVLTGRLSVVDDAGGWTLTKGGLARMLETCGVPPNLSANLALRVLGQLVAQRRDEIPVAELAQRVDAQLQSAADSLTRQRFRAWLALVRSRLPLVVLIGGVSGAGKSSIAAHCSLHLDIARTQSTDILREVLRDQLPADQAPALHCSSFESSADPEACWRGFLAQAEHLAGAVDSIIRRSAVERSSTLIEGVHLLPATGLRHHAEAALIVPVMIAVTQAATLRERYRYREQQTPDRPGDRYLRHFDGIWALQKRLLQQAADCKVPVLVNVQQAATHLQLLQVIADAVLARFPA